MKMMIKGQQIHFNWLQWRFLRRSPSFSAVLSSARFALEKGIIREKCPNTSKKKFAFGKSKNILLVISLKDFARKLTDETEGEAEILDSKTVTLAIIIILCSILALIVTFQACKLCRATLW